MLDIASRIPRDWAPDSSLAFRSEGYRFITNRCRKFNSDIFEVRLLGKPCYCVYGAEAARMFYQMGRFTRQGGLPLSALRLLQDEGSLSTLDGDAHRLRKAMFLSLMEQRRVDDAAEIAAEELRSKCYEVNRYGPVTMHSLLRTVLCRAACRWAGVPIIESEMPRLVEELGDMIDNAASIGPANWAARVERWNTERFLRILVQGVRDDSLRPPTESALSVIAHWREPHGRELPEEICAIELINILRPMVAIARFMTFAALAEFENPRYRTLLIGDDAFLEAFVQEVRRISPFFPFVAGVARVPFEWMGQHFRVGDRFLLDLYGTNHDPRLWDDPDTFMPERFLSWSGDPFTMIPQGGGDHRVNHRCAGEWLTIAVMKSMLRVLVRNVEYAVPAQDLTVDLTQIPALPASGLVVEISAVYS